MTFTHSGRENSESALEIRLEIGPRPLLSAALPPEVWEPPGLSVLIREGLSLQPLGMASGLEGVSVVTKMLGGQLSLPCSTSLVIFVLEKLHRKQQSFKFSTWAAIYRIIHECFLKEINLTFVFLQK